jgi:hypothetical protein
MFWSRSHVILIKGNNLTYIGYNINYMNVFELLRDNSSLLDELEKMFYILLNSIDCKIINQCGMRFKFHSKNKK